jgi:hypothetical protein
MEPNPLDELYQVSRERMDGRYKVISAAYVVQMIDMYRARDKAVEARKGT